jgi:hypothetical protein
MRDLIQHIREDKDIFKPSTPKDREARAVEWTKMWEDRIEEIDIIRDLVEKNIYKTGGFTDEEWIAIVREWLRQNPQNMSFGSLEDLSHDLQGLLMSFDDAVYVIKKK